MTDIRTMIQQEMHAAFPVVEDRVVNFYAMQEYHLGWRDSDLKPASCDPGKLLRPQLALLTCRAVGGDVAQALPLAAGIQLIHDFSLIHDDIEDNSDTRRGRVTVWKQWGLAHGINAGDGMFVIAHLALHRLVDTGVLPEIALEILKRFDQTILTICEGQFLDLSFEGNLCINETDYLSMISRKTAALIACASSLGALVGQAHLDHVQTWFDFGQNLGLAFQIEDDIIGIWGDPAITGKPRAADIYRRKVSLPIVHALQHGDHHDHLKALYQRQELDDRDVDHVLTILESVGSRTYTERVAATYHTKALQALDQAYVGDSHGAQEAFAHIRAIANKLLGRQA